MLGEVQTVRVVSTDEASQGPFVVINAADFDPALHTLYEDDAAPEPDHDTSDPAPIKRRPGRPRKEG